MPILASEIQFFESALSGLGGSISNNQITSGNVNNVFDNVNSQEAIDGDEEYRCIYVKNANSSIELLNAVIFFGVNTTSPDTSMQIGLDPVGINGSAQSIVTENDPPVGVTFVDAVDYDNGLTIGDIPENGGYQAIWLKRVVTPGAEAVANDTATITVQGETVA